METEFQVERRSFSTAQATCDAIPSVDPIRQENRGQLLSDFHQFLGDDAEPDTLFFVESWTFGIPKAVENARQRQRGKPDREQQSRLFRQFANLGSQFYVEEALRTAEQFRSSHNADGAPMHREWFPAQTYGVTPQESSDWPEGCDDNQETSLPVTHDRACRILGVSTTSTRGEIKAAYRRMVNRWHPDRLECKAEEERQIATLKMTAINEAYRLLCSDLRKPV
jgi:DnaJ-domain-containing protein 1